MVFLLELASPSTLITYLNCILVGVVIFYSIEKFSHIVEAGIYAVAETLIPIITRMFLGSVLGINVAVGLGSIFILLVTYFVIGLLVIKITKKVTNFFNSDTILYFIITFSIIDFITIRGIVIILKLIIQVIG